MALRIVWAFLPILYILVALYTYMEARMWGRSNLEAKKLFSQTVFVTFATIATLSIDIYISPTFIEPFLVENFPDGTYLIYRLLTLPFFLLCFSKIIGPTKELLITRAPPLHSKKKYDPLR